MLHNILSTTKLTRENLFIKLLSTHSCLTTNEHLVSCLLRTLPLCYHRGSNWGSSTRGTALTRYVFIGCYDSGNNPDSNACRFKVCLNPSKTEPGLVMWWSMHNTYFVSHQTEVLKLLFISQNFLSFCSILVIISLYTLNSGWNRTCFAFACLLACKHTAAFLSNLVCC